MNIELHNIGKRFNNDWIFRNLNLNFSNNNSYTITGSNGSGKSTLLQIILGFVLPTEGQIDYTENDNIIDTNNIFSNSSIAAPYIELIEEMTAIEFLEFHLKFKTLINTKSFEEILESVQLLKAKDKQIRFFSSGMKQRLKLAQAFFSDTNILLLDEPCSNLDQEGILLYHNLIKEYTKNRLLIICSNEEQEYSFCNINYDLNILK